MAREQKGLYTNPLVILLNCLFQQPSWVLQSNFHSPDSNIYRNGLHTISLLQRGRVKGHSFMEIVQNMRNCPLLLIIPCYAEAVYCVQLTLSCLVREMSGHLLFAHSLTVIVNDVGKEP